METLIDVLEKNKEEVEKVAKMRGVQFEYCLDDLRGYEFRVSRGIYHTMRTYSSQEWEYAAGTDRNNWKMAAIDTMEYMADELDALEEDRPATD